MFFYSPSFCFHFEGVFDSLTKAVCGSSSKAPELRPQTVKECFLKYTACCLFLSLFSSYKRSVFRPGELFLWAASLLLNPELYLSYFLTGDGGDEVY